MKQSIVFDLFLKSRFLQYVILYVFLSSCNFPGLSGEPEEGELRISFAHSQETLTRAGLEIPDTSDFILKVTSADGSLVYDGPYGDFPESVTLASGSYTVSVVSEKFSKPAFAAPQFGDEQCVILPSGGTVDVRLLCTQLNSGIRLHLDPDFLDAYPHGVLLLKSALGRLVYGYSEKRIAYFAPGAVSLALNEGADDRILMTRELKAQEILDLKIKVTGKSGTSTVQPGMAIQIDTSRTWISDVYDMGSSDGQGSGTYDAMSVYDAIDNVGAEEVWVSGYIVGGDLSSSSASFESPFTSRTNILLGPKKKVSSRNSCISVQLMSGELRDALNLVDNPELLGRKICLEGDIVASYYGLVGIKNIVDYELF